MKLRKTEITKEQYTKALESWESFVAPFEGSHINSCVTAATNILKYEEQEHKSSGKTGAFNKRLSKYETQNNLRFVFSKTGKVSIHAHFPNTKKLGCPKLGEYPELQLRDARELTESMQDGILQFHSVEYVIDAYEESLKARNKTAPTKFGKKSLKTYQCRLIRLKKHFNLQARFTSYSAGKLEEVLDSIIANETNNQAIEQYAEICRIWKWAAAKYNNDKNPAASVDTFYVSDRVDAPAPCQAYTDLDSIAELWLNLASCPNIHQKNAVRFMILTGLRPINIPQIKWEWLDSITFPRFLTFPPSYVGVRGYMKNQSEFKIPLTNAMREIIKEQRAWMEAALPNCNSEFVFLQPSDPTKPFAQRSLDKLVKDYSPIDAVKGDNKAIIMKGSAGAFCTMCRSFFKSNAKNQLIDLGIHKVEAEALTRMALHHIRKTDDPNGINYDKSEQLFGTGTKLKFGVFKAHGANVLTRAKQLSGQSLRQTGLEKAKQDRKLNNQQKNTLRAEIKSFTGKESYSNFINQYIGDCEEKIKELIHYQEGRELIKGHLKELKLKSAS